MKALTSLVVLITTLIMINGLNAELPAGQGDNSAVRQQIVSELLTPTFGNFANNIAKAFQSEDRTAIENAFRDAGWDWGYFNEPMKTGYDETPCNPQSIRLLVCSTDIINKLSTIDTSPCPPGQTIDERSFGTPN